MNTIVESREMESFAGSPHDFIVSKRLGIQKWQNTCQDLIKAFYTASKQCATVPDSQVPNMIHQNSTL